MICGRLALVSKLCSIKSTPFSASIDTSRGRPCRVFGLSFPCGRMRSPVREFGRRSPVAAGAPFNFKSVGWVLLSWRLGGHRFLLTAPLLLRLRWREFLGEQGAHGASDHC